MPNPRDVNIDIVGHDHLDRATRSAERELSSLERKIDRVGRTGDRVGRASEDLRRRWDRSFETGPIGNKLEKLSGNLLKVAAAGGASAGALGALQPVVAGLVTTLAPAAAALGVFGGVLSSVFGDVSEASQKNNDLVDKIQLYKEMARVLRQRGDTEGAAKAMDKAAKAAVELRARYNLLNPDIAQAVDKLDQLKMTWDDFVAKNTPRTVEALTRAFELLIRTIPKLQPLFDAGADATERFLGFIERKERDGTIDRFITFLADKAPDALSTVADALGTTWDVLQTGWEWWGKLSTAVMTSVDQVRIYVLTMRLNWYTTLAQMYGDSAEFLRNAAGAFGKLPGIGEKTRAALMNAAAGLDESAARAQQAADQIQGSIDAIHGKRVDVTVHYTKTGEGGYGTPYSNDPRAINGDGRHVAFDNAPGLQAAWGGGGSTMPPQEITVTAPPVNVAVSIPGLGAVLTGIVRAEVGRQLGTAGRRASVGRAV